MKSTYLAISPIRKPGFWLAVAMREPSRASSARAFLHGDSKAHILFQQAAGRNFLRAFRLLAVRRLTAGLLRHPITGETLRNAFPRLFRLPVHGMASLHILRHGLTSPLSDRTHKILCGWC